MLAVEEVADDFKGGPGFGALVGVGPGLWEVAEEGVEGGRGAGEEGEGVGEGEGHGGRVARDGVGGQRGQLLATSR